MAVDKQIIQESEGKWINSTIKKSINGTPMTITNTEITTLEHVVDMCSVAHYRSLREAGWKPKQ